MLNPQNVPHHHHHTPLNEITLSNGSHPLYIHYTTTSSLHQALHHQHSWRGRESGISAPATRGVLTDRSLSLSLWQTSEGSCQPHSASITVSGYGQLRCNNPNPHSRQFPHFCLLPRPADVHNHLCASSIPPLP